MDQKPKIQDPRHRLGAKLSSAHLPAHRPCPAKIVAGRWMGMGNGQGGVIDAQQSAPRPAQFPFAQKITMTTYNDSVGVGEVIND